MGCAKIDGAPHFVGYPARVEANRTVQCSCIVIGVVNIFS